MNDANLFGVFIGMILGAAVQALFLWIVDAGDAHYAMRILQWVCLGLAGLIGSYLLCKGVVRRSR